MGNSERNASGKKQVDCGGRRGEGANWGTDSPVLRSCLERTGRWARRQTRRQTTADAGRREGGKDEIRGQHSLSVEKWL